MSLLDLKNNTGSLGKHWLDLPCPRSTPEPYYFRRREPRLLPPSYRSGLVFFAAIMIVSVLGLTGIHAQSLAEIQQSLILSRQIANGNQALEQLIKIWENAEKLPLLDQLDQMKPMAEKASASWDEGNFLNVFLEGQPILRSLLGEKNPQRLLVFLQDPAEKRATGGTLAAGVEILLNEGQVITWKPFLTQDYDALLMMKTPPPAELSAITDHWGLSTANSFLDLSQSAQKMHWFWQRTAHSSADAIIMINTNALQKIFADSGLLDSLATESLEKFKDFGARWTALRGSEQPEELKNLASASVEALLSVAKDPNFLIAAWPTIESMVRQKHMMIVSTDPHLQAELDGFGLSATLPSPAAHQDLLMVGSINTEANSSDKDIDEYVRLDTIIDANGSIRHWLKIERQHLGTGSPNRSLMRILTPLGSQLSATDGLNLNEISTMNTDHFTVWSFLVTLAPGESKPLALSYTLPWSFDTTQVDNYRLTLLKQPGTNPMPFQHHLKLPADLTIFQQLPEQAIEMLDRDIDIAVVAGKNP